MSYADARVSPAEKVRAAATVIAVHATIGAGVVFGLSVTGVIPVPLPNPKGVRVTPVPIETPPPPPPIEPADPIQTLPKSPPVQAPDSPLDFNTDRDFVKPFNDEPFVYEVPIPGPIGNGDIDVGKPPVTPSPKPAPTFTPKAPAPTNGPAGWITNGDYPSSDLRREREGIAQYRLVIGSNGRVNDCTIINSTGHSSLDTATCRLIQRRARFDAATNERGATVVGTYTGSVTWRIPE